MKAKVFTLAILLILLSAGHLSSKELSGSDNKSTLTVYSNPALVGLTSAWAKEYSNTYPGISIKVVETRKSVVEGIDQTAGNLCFVPAGNTPDENKTEGFRLVVGRDVFVPVMNRNNPYTTDIEKQGISRDALAGSLSGRQAMQWGTLLNNRSQSAVHYFILDDAAAASALAEYLGSVQSVKNNMKPLNKAALISAVEKDIYAIGFCRLNDVLTPDQQNFTSDIRLMPLDKNGNGRMDYMEKIYDNPRDFSRGVWIGRYPKALGRNIYAVSGMKPTNQAEVNFLGWVLTKGQTVLNSNGYTDLLASERQSQITRLIEAPPVTAAVQEARPLWRVVFTIVIFLALLGAVIELVISRFRRTSNDTSGLLQGKQEGFSENNVVIPKGLYFDKTHTWAFMEKDGRVKVGIDDFLQHVTGPITSIGMKSPGVKVNKGDQLCVMIQKGKHLIVNSPVSGVIREQNPVLFANASLVNDSPYGEGWVCIIEPNNWIREIGFLSMADKYGTWLKSEFARLKDFLASALQPDSLVLSHVVMQDGGAVCDHVLADLGPEVWEDFQTRFMNTSS